MDRRKFFQLGLRLGAGAAVLGTAGVCYGFAEAVNVVVEHVHFPLPNLDPAFAGLQIAFLADIHLGKYVEPDFVQSIVRTTNALQPDIILLGGDYNLGATKFIAPCFEILSMLRAPLGKFAVCGNHDHYSGVDLTIECMKKAKIVPFENTGEWFTRRGARLRIGGVEDLWRGEPKIAPAIGDVKQGEPCIIVSHNPDFAETMKDERVGLMLSGHTHGGQVYVPGMKNPFLPSAYGEKYSQGLVQAPKTKVYVSRGLGLTGLPVRYNCTPELTMLTLESS